MSSKLKSTLTVLLLISFSNLTPLLAQSAALLDDDCLGHVALSVFRHSPGGYELGEPIDGKLCTTLCEDIAMPLAVISRQGACLCAPELDPEVALSKVDAKLCEGDEGMYFKFYEGKKTAPEDGLTIKALSDSVYADEVIAFETNFEDLGSDTQVQMDYGDGYIGNWTDIKKHEHIFRLPGHYVVTVHAKQVGNTARRIAAASARVTIAEKFSENEVKFDCLSIIEPGDHPGCNATFHAGQDMTIEVNFGDGSDSLVFNSTGKSRTPFVLPSAPLF